MSFAHESPTEKAMKIQIIDSLNSSLEYVSNKSAAASVLLQSELPDLPTADYFSYFSIGDKIDVTLTYKSEFVYDEARAALCSWTEEIRETPNSRRGVRGNISITITFWEHK